MGIFESIVLGFVQGATEFIPVSSSGHLIFVHQLFGATSADLSIDAVLQLATTLAVIVYFWRDILDLFKTLFDVVARKPVESSKKTLLYAIIIGTIPAVIFGLLLETKMETIFRSSHLVAWMLIIGALLMFVAERTYKANASLSTSKGFFVGLFQCLALVPGISRSGSTISGGMILGLSRKDATRFSFLLSIPIIAGSGLKMLLDLAKTGTLSILGFPFLLSFVVAFLVGLFAIRFLINFLKTNSLQPFIIYRVVIAILVLIFL